MMLTTEHANKVFSLEVLMFCCIWGGHNYIHGSCTANLDFKGAAFVAAKCGSESKGADESREKRSSEARLFCAQLEKCRAIFPQKRIFSPLQSVWRRRKRWRLLLLPASRSKYYKARLQSHSRAYRVFITSVKRNYHEIMALSLQSQLLFYGSEVKV